MNATLFRATLHEKLANRLVLVLMTLVVIVLPAVQFSKLSTPIIVRGYPGRQKTFSFLRDNFMKALTGDR